MNRRRGAPLLALLFLLLLSACKVELFSGLGEHEANDMMAALLRRGIPAEKAPGLEGTYVLMVEEARGRQDGLPHRYAPGAE